MDCKRIQQTWANFINPMPQDTEIETLNGTLIQQVDRLGVDMLINKYIYGGVKVSPAD